MLVYIAYMDPMGIATECIIQPVIITFLIPQKYHLQWNDHPLVTHITHQQLYNQRRVIYTPWLFNIAMDNGPFIDGLPINSMVIFHGYVK